jgi:two-component system sensor histidine kinase ChvG
MIGGHAGQDRVDRPTIRPAIGQRSPRKAAKRTGTGVLDRARQSNRTTPTTRGATLDGDGLVPTGAISGTAGRTGLPSFSTLARARRLLARTGRRIAQRFASSLARRILLLNLAGLLVLLLGVLWLNQTRVGVIEARVQSLLVQGEIIAAAIAGSATVDTDTITIDPERLLSLQAGESAPDDPNPSLEFSINPEKVAPILRRLVAQTRLRARVYDRDALLLVDSKALMEAGDFSRMDLPPPEEAMTVVERAWSFWKRRFGRAEIIPGDDGTPQKPFSEVQRALAGISSSVVRLSARGETIVYVAMPIQRFRTVRGALQVSTQEGDIDTVIGDERINILVLFSVVTAVMVLLSLLMANTIARPVERLAAGADRVRRSIKSRHQIPDFSHRSDEIGRLSTAIRDMTNALYRRMESIESFAADVAHELKNPLTSLRSAVETLPLVRDDGQRARLLGVIQHDVRRLDRLISDISDASRLDAELARADAEPVDMLKLVTAVVEVANELRKPEHPTVTLTVRNPPAPKGSGKGQTLDAFTILGHDSRLGQVINNLLDNAKSFSPPGSTVSVTLKREDSHVIVEVADEGCGIPEHALERIFERFYTDRPEEQGFGQNSGLGLSISRQIVEAHRGSISAANRPGKGDTASGGAILTVRLPIAA